MRKLPLFSAVLLLFLLVPASITRAQTISTQKGLTTAVFNLSKGKIKIYLPDDIRPGDIISGTIAGVGEENKDMFELIKYNVGINGSKFPVGNKPSSFTIQVPAETQQPIVIELIDSKGKKSGQLDCYLQLKENGITSPGCSMPSHVLAGEHLSVTGSFDGNASNTKCLLGNKPSEILTESPRQMCSPVSIDLEDPGTNRAVFTVQENGKALCSKIVSVVDMQVTAGELKLRKGQNTYVYVKITGLQNLPDTALLTVINQSADVVVMHPSNAVAIPLSPDSVDSGTFNKRFEIQSIKTGSFSVNVKLDLPEENPPIFADVRKPEGGKRDEGVLTAGTRSALEIGMKKWADANTEGKNPVDYDCPNCFQCIKSLTTASNVSQVGGLGWGIITSFLSGGVKFAGGILEKVKDIADKGGDIYKALKEMIDAGQIQVVGIKEQWCPNNEYCKVTGIIVYDVKTGCVEAVYKCIGTKMCCPFAETTYTLKYCLDKDGAVIAETVSLSISH